MEHWWDLLKVIKGTRAMSITRWTDFTHCSGISIASFELLTNFFPMSPFDPPENIKKPKIFWSFQGIKKEYREETVKYRLGTYSNVAHNKWRFKERLRHFFPVFPFNPLPLKISKNLWLSKFFRENQKEKWGRNRLK